MKKFIYFMFMVMISETMFAQSPYESQVIEMNGIDLYYEVYGEGKPLLLLHGWTQSSQFWAEYIPTYAKYYKVYALDLRGHGRTSQLTDDFTIKKTSEDILKFISELKLVDVKAIGLSFGGLALLELAVSNPEKIESMILVGVTRSFNGGENNDGSFSFENLPLSFIRELKEIHYHGESQIKAMFDANLDYQINLTDQEVGAIDSRCLIVQGDRDEILGIDPAIELHKKLSHSELWIVPNTGHMAINGPNRDDFLKKSIQFLNQL